MFAKGETIIQFLEQLAPKQLAQENDKIGLQIGTLHKEVRHVWIALDIVDAVVEEAIAASAELIVAHHPIIYRPLEHIRTDTPQGLLYEKLIKHHIAVYIAHTNLDIAEGGMNDMLAKALGLTGLKPLELSGLGRVGQLAEACSTADLVEQVKQAFGVANVRVVGHLSRKLRKVAVLGGSGGRYIQQAINACADVFISGDIDYHTAQDALAAGLTIIDPGHNIEKIMKEQVANYFNEVFLTQKYATKATASKINTEPFQFR